MYPAILTQILILPPPLVQFKCIWKEAQYSGRSRTVISDEIGRTLIDLQNQLEESSLFDDLETRRAVLKLGIPKTLIDNIGLETIMSRLPETYQKSMFAR